MSLGKLFTHMYLPLSSVIWYWPKDVQMDHQVVREATTSLALAEGNGGLSPGFCLNHLPSDRITKHYSGVKAAFIIYMLYQGIYCC